MNRRNSWFDVSDGFTEALEDFNKCFDPSTNWLWHQGNNTSKYPPYNITKNGDAFTIELALAGFSIKDITITLVGSTLTIAGNKDDKTTGEEIHRGISSRAFSTSFTLGTDVEVEDATMLNGLLTIKTRYKAPTNGAKNIPIRSLILSNQPKEFLSEDKS